MLAVDERKRFETAFREALVTILATIATFTTILALAVALHADASVAVMAAAIALSLGRRPRAHGEKLLLSQWLALPVVAVVAGGVGLALRAVPIVGAIAFVTGLFFSVWLRQFGERARRAGATIALPFIAILIVPPPRTTGAPWTSVVLLLAVGIVALAWVRALQWLMQRTGFIEAPVASPLEDVARPASSPVREKKVRVFSPTTRFAIQMAVALGAAFAIGMSLVPQHWSWVVLTAFIVCSGNVGRGDVAYKSLLRLVGAIAGTVVATLLQLLPNVSGVSEAAVIFTALFFGLWLRAANYAYWAACITLVVALLQRDAGGDALVALLQRIEGITLGALCGIAASWFVLPIRTRAVVYLRLAEALVALDEAIGSTLGTERARKSLVFESRLERLERVAPVFRLHWLVRRGSPDDDHPAVWIDALRRCRPHVHSFDGDPAAAAKAIRIARRSIGRRARPDESAASSDAAPDSLTEALHRVRSSLDSTACR